MMEQLLTRHPKFCAEANRAKRLASRGASFKRNLFIGGALLAAIPCLYSGPGVAICAGAGTALGVTGVITKTREIKKSIAVFLLEQDLYDIANLPDLEGTILLEKILLPLSLWGTTGRFLRYFRNTQVQFAKVNTEHAHLYFKDLEHLGDLSEHLGDLSFFHRIRYTGARKLIAKAEKILNNHNMSITRRRAVVQASVTNSQDEQVKILKRVGFSNKEVDMLMNRVIRVSDEVLEASRLINRKKLWEHYYESLDQQIPKRFDTTQSMSFKQMEEFTLRKQIYVIPYENSTYTSLVADEIAQGARWGERWLDHEKAIELLCRLGQSRKVLDASIVGKIKSFTSIITAFGSLGVVTHKTAEVFIKAIKHINPYKFHLYNTEKIMLRYLMRMHGQVNNKVFYTATAELSEKIGMPHIVYAVVNARKFDLLSELIQKGMLSINAWSSTIQLILIKADVRINTKNLLRRILAETSSIPAEYHQKIEGALKLVEKGKYGLYLSVDDVLQL